MYPYFFLILVPLSLEIWLKYNHKRITVGHSTKALNGENAAIVSFFFLFLILLSVRSETVGRDLSNYRVIFNNIGKNNFQFQINIVNEPIFKLYTWFIYNYISKNYQVYLAITAIISVLSIAYVYTQNGKHGCLQIAIFINMSTFIMLFSGIRQGLAMSMGMLAYQSLKKRNNVLFLILAFVASLIHHTGFMVFFFFPLWKIKTKKISLLWMIPLILLVVALNKQIFNALARIMADQNEKYDVVAGSTGAFGSFVLFTLFSVFSFVVTDDKKMNEEAIALRNILVFATVLQSFASLNNLVMRMNYYFVLLVPMAVGNCLEYLNVRYKQIAQIAEIIISAFFTLVFLYSTYNSFITGVSALDTIPYVPFWQG